MLDDLREQADTSPLFDLEDEAALEELKIATERPFLGMTPAQRFVIALILFLMIFILGAFCLLVFERIMPPFLF